MMSDEDLAKAFNQGSDARIAGVPLKENRYEPATLTRDYWKKGWCHANEHWGTGCKRNRPARELPAVTR